MRIDVVTIFPELIESFASTSLIGKAARDGLVRIAAHNLRDFSDDAHRSVDDSPFGGGAGMVMKPEPLFRVIEERDCPRPVIYVAPSGRPFTQAVANELAALDGFTLICGRFEGIDERVREHLVDDELSIGDYVLAGGEVAASVVIEAVARLVPGVLGNASSVEDESFSDGLLEYPHYTRPASFRGWEVPPVLRSGNHERVRRWRKAQSLLKTATVRPDLLAARGGLNEADRRLLAEFNLNDQVADTGGSGPEHR